MGTSLSRTKGTERQYLQPRIAWLRCPGDRMVCPGLDGHFARAMQTAAIAYRKSRERADFVIVPSVQAEKMRVRSG
jgi:hypothetical protein